MGSDTGSFLARLRAETRAEHERVEREIPVLREDLNVATYRRILARLYGYHAPLETRLALLAEDFPAELDWPKRGKCAALREDLAALGLEDEALHRLPYCPSLPDLSSTPRIYGCLYVMEGASLGGQVICRHLEGLAPPIAQNRRFFRGYGEETGARWKTFRRLLILNVPTVRDQDEAISAAKATFETFASWMSEDELL